MNGSGRAWIELLESARKSADVAYHVFLARYSKNAREVYAIIEGKDDHSFYNYLLERDLPESWNIWTWPAGGKPNVYKAHASIDWARFDSRRVCFFVDRDFSDFVEDTRISANNIYVTDGYSIENSIITPALFAATFAEIYGIFDLSREESDSIARMFETELIRFIGEIELCIAQMCHWRMKQSNANLRNFNIGKAVNFGVLGVDPVDKDLLLDTLASHAGCERSTSAELESVCDMIQSHPSDDKDIVRGKQLIWIFLGLLDCMSKNFGLIVPRHNDARMSPRITLSQKNAVFILGPRARIPESLRKFSESNYHEYIKSVV